MRLQLPRICTHTIFLFFLASVASTCGLATEPQPPATPFFETGYIPVGDLKHAYFPNLAKLPDGRILCAYSHGSLPRLDSIRALSTPDAGRTWSKAVIAIQGRPTGYIADPNVLVVGKRATIFATFVHSLDPPFARSQYWHSTSTDGGLTWGKFKILPIERKYVTGKVHVPVKLRDGTIVMGYGWDVKAEKDLPASTEPDMLCRAGMLRSTDGGQTWQPGADVPIDQPLSLDEPASVQLRDGSLFVILRTIGPRPYEVLSRDGGLSWQTPRESRFEGHNTPSALLRLRDGSILRSWDMSPKNRYPLVVSLTTDETKTWSKPRTLSEPKMNASGVLSYQTACYPSIAQADDGTILIAWWETGKFGSRLGYARFNRAWVGAGQG